MKKPTQCVLWNKTGLAPTDLNLELLEVFLREPKKERDLFKCRECGQLYFHEWYEHIDFNHDAFMYETYIPIESKEEVQTVLDAKTSADLAQFVPQLHGSFTNEAGGTLRWVENCEV